MSDGQQLDLFSTTWRDLPVLTPDESRVAAFKKCPRCKRNLGYYGGGPVVEDGVLVGFYSRNGCCGYSWFRTATPEQVENAKSWARSATRESTHG